MLRVENSGTVPAIASQRREGGGMGGWGAILDGSEVVLVSFAGSGYGYLPVG